MENGKFPTNTLVRRMTLRLETTAERVWDEIEIYYSPEAELIVFGVATGPENSRRAVIRLTLLPAEARVLTAMLREAARTFEDAEARRELERNRGEQ